MNTKVMDHINAPSLMRAKIKIFKDYKEWIKTHHPERIKNVTESKFTKRKDYNSRLIRELIYSTKLSKELRNQLYENGISIKQFKDRYRFEIMKMLYDQYEEFRPALIQYFNESTQ